MGELAFRLGWFSTGRDEAARMLLEVVYREVVSGFLPVELACVFCSREPGETPESDRFLELVRDLGLPLVYFSASRFRPDLRRASVEEWRLAYDREVLARVEPLGADAVLLAGYMLIAGPEMCRRLAMVNLHPAPPGGPAGTWQEVIWTLIGEGAREAGAMTHVVTEELDRGPAVAYFTFPLDTPEYAPLWEQWHAKCRTRTPAEIIAAEGENEPLFRKIRADGVRREPALLVVTIKALAEGGLRVAPGAVCDAAGRPVPGRCVNEEVAAWLAARGGWGCSISPIARGR